MRRLLLGLGLPALAGCYQAFGAGYVHRFAEEGGHSFEGQYLIGIGKVIDADEPAITVKVSISGGSWGMRAADVIGVMVQETLDGMSFFLRPGLDLLVIGAEASRDDVWIGIGADLDAGFLFPLDDELALELGVRAGADLSYSGHGSGAFAGAYLAVGWIFDGPDWDTH